MTLTPDNRPGTVILGGSFTDVGTLDGHTVTIEWGDGTTEVLADLAGGVTPFSGIEHHYLDQRPRNAPYTVRVTVADEDSVSTAARTMLQKTYQVAVADGQLIVRLRDLGGQDPHVALAALTFSDAGSAVPPADSTEPALMMVAPSPSPDPVLMLDVNGDSFVTPLDALLTIHYLNSYFADDAEGEVAGDAVLYADVNDELG